jgi:hypothetical protein
MVDCDHCINTAFTEQQDMPTGTLAHVCWGCEQGCRCLFLEMKNSVCHPLLPSLAYMCGCVRREVLNSQWLQGFEDLRLFYSTCTQDIVSGCKLTSLTRLEITVHRTHVACTHHITAVSAHQELSTGTCRLHVCWGHEQTVIDVSLGHEDHCLHHSAPFPGIHV